MAPTALITFRETIEAALIVAMIIGVFIRLRQYDGIKTVLIGIVAALGASVILGSGMFALGAWFTRSYEGQTGELIEGVLALGTALLVTGAVLTLDRHFRRYKISLIQRVTSKIESRDRVGLVLITFTSVFREAVEIILLVSGLTLTTATQEIMQGFGLGLVSGLAVSVLLMTAAIRLPVRVVFRVTTYLLIFFAAGLIAKGVQGLTESGILPEVYTLTLYLIPVRETLTGGLVYAMFGLRQTMDILQVSLYLTYAYGMIRLIRQGEVRV